MGNPLENSGYEASVMVPNNTMDNRKIGFLVTNPCAYPSQWLIWTITQWLVSWFPPP